MACGAGDLFKAYFVCFLRGKGTFCGVGDGDFYNLGEGYPENGYAMPVLSPFGSFNSSCLGV